VSAPNAWKSRLSSTMDNPKVESTGTSGPARALGFEHGLLQQPPHDRHQWQHDEQAEKRRKRRSGPPTRTARKPASTARLPCARLMMRMTLNRNESPQAINA